MQARSIVFDIFGDYVRETGGSIPLQQLTAVLECFGVSPDPARVIMSRLTREGWFRVERAGRSSLYTPSDKGWELLDTGLTRIMERPPPDTWTGIWYTVMFNVPEKDRAARVRLKTKLSWLGFGQLSPATWLSAHDVLDEAEKALDAEPSARYDLFESRSRGRKTDIQRAHQCWDLDTLAVDYREFTERCRRLVESGHPALTGVDALVTRTDLIHSYRKFPFRDPELPPELLPADWPAEATHEAFLTAFRALHHEAMTFFLQVTAARAA